MWETGWEGMRLGIAAFLIPFAFVYNPGLLLQGDLADIITAVVTAIIGASLLAAGVRGYLLDFLNPVQRVILIGGGLLLIAPGLTLPGIGLAVSLIAAAPQIHGLVRRSNH